MSDVVPQDHSKALHVLSLFAGIGGIDLGLERAGMRVVAHAEVDPYASAVLAKHWPDVPNHGDVTQIRAEDVPPIDVIAGGFPCQDISLAGKGAGITEGTRSGLWSEYARLVRELRPRYVIVENVAALLARGLDRVLGDLAALGYGAWWDCVPAAAVGAPHRRDRLFVVATRADVAPFDTHATPMQWAAKLGREPHGNPAFAAAHAGGVEHEGDRPALGGEATEGLRGPAGDANGAPADTHPAPGGSRGAARQPGWWGAEPDVGRVAHGIPRRVDRLRCLGNAVVPQVAQYIGELVVAHDRAGRAVA